MDSYQQEITLLKALSHPARLAILEILRSGEACVCHLVALLGWRQAYISQQLMVLRAAGLVADRREGNNIFYRATNPEIYNLIDVLHHVSKSNAALPPLNEPVACSCPRCKGRAA